MNALLDTCVVMDFLQKRDPFAGDANAIFVAAATEQFSGFLTAKAATDIFYLSHRSTHSTQSSRELLDRLLSILGLLDTAAEDVFHALHSGISDFEDAVMIAAAVRSHMDCIVTRNIRDYRDSPIPVFTPEQFLAQL